MTEQTGKGTLMDQMDNAKNSLGKLEWRVLQELMLAVSRGHAQMCIAASQDIDPHASDETMRLRIADMAKDDLVAALAPFAALGAIAVTGT